ncbi:hypothetical protein J7T55_001045 [Diaporthe amygdali]|uniref:uncharacterized protein n=1 Tax=Phomopsis amygdali TaxID=1214568 RepID=UPI0022FF210F|nr:uncharacterized protein J7T55_001045 [Diaporthe amygdali]KAJ0120189.1 hypothetical protein J7T55_001045 [Diaporthe amygdali]
MNSAISPFPTKGLQESILQGTPPAKAASHLRRLSSNAAVAQIRPNGKLRVPAQQGPIQSESNGSVANSKIPQDNGLAPHKTTPECIWRSGSEIQHWASSVPIHRLGLPNGLGSPPQFGNNGHPGGFYQAGVALTSYGSSSSGQSVLHIPKSNTWSVTSTIQRISTDNNGFPTESSPARVESIVKSTPFAVPSGPFQSTTGRTSISALPKSFDTGTENNQEVTIDRKFTNDGESEKPKPHLLLGHKAESKARPCMDVVDEHPVEEYLNLAPQRDYLRLKSPLWNKTSRDQGHQKGEIHSTDSVDTTSPKLRCAELRSNDQISSQPDYLDGTPNMPATEENNGAPKPQRKGKVSELRKAFERGLLDLLRKKQPTESSEGGPVPQSAIKHLQPPRHSVQAKNTDSPEDNLSKSSLICSPLPTSFRRESNCPSSPLKDKISIFEGLVKPNSSSSFVTSPLQEKSNIKAKESPFLTGSKILQSEVKESTSRLPNKLRGTSGKRNIHDHAAREKGDSKGKYSVKVQAKSLSEPSVSAKEPTRRLQSEQLSSTFKNKHKPPQKQLIGTKSSMAGRGIEEEATPHFSEESQSTPTGQKKNMGEQRQKAAAESLRKRLESELRTSTSINGHQDIQAGQRASGKQQGKPLPGVQSCQNDTGQNSTSINHPKVKLWDIENPFKVSKTKDNSDGGDFDNRGSDDFRSVALARVPCKQSTLHHTSSASRHRQPTPTSGSYKMGNGTPNEDSSEKSKEETDHSDKSDFVVVANAECELTHPRPSRSSDKKMIKVLCKCGREPGEDEEDGGRESLVSASEGSTSSFHTAPVIASVC